MIKEPAKKKTKVNVKKMLE